MECGKNIRSGFTLVELLVVIAIIGMLVGLLLPAVQQAREAARQMQCNNHLRQMGLAVLNCETTIRKLPGGGWWGSWLGDGDRGFSQHQPGSWQFSILPFMEQNALFQLPTDTNFEIKSDYACCVGDTHPCCSAPGGTKPTALADGNDLIATNAWVPVGNGAIYHVSQVTIAEIRDGTTNTYLLGEKYLNPQLYLPTDTSNLCYGDDGCAYSGGDGDNQRSTGSTPRQDRTGYTVSSVFGSSHSGSFGMAMCDGSVHRVSYSIDAETHRDLGIRNDGRPVRLPD
ncbi:MAG: DUF1559 domain-containing protein [Planctomycetia bacterium]|nr:DUF1559 domain-containing protein [Planctomycetia bacterium]